MLTSENDAANNPLVSILWPRRGTQNSSSSVFLFFIFPFMHLSTQRFRWLQFEGNLLQLLMAASAAVHAGMGISLTWMQEQITHQSTQRTPALWSSQKEKSRRGKGNRRQISYPEGLPRRCSGKEHTDQCRRRKRHRFNPWVRKIPWRRVMATYSSILAWRIPRTEEPGGLQSMVSQSQTRLTMPTYTQAYPDRYIGSVLVSLGGHNKGG